MADPVMGAGNHLGIKKETTEGTAVTVNTLLELISGDIGLTEEAVDTNGMTGTRSHWSARTRAGTRKVSGSITLQPNAIEWSVLLPWIFGADASGTTFALAETLPSYTVVKAIDNGTDGKVMTYNGVKVNKAVISGEAGGSPLSLQLDLEGWDEAVGNAATFPSISLNVATGPFLFSDSAGAITVGGSAYGFKRFSLTIDNALDTDRILNSTIRSGLPSRDRLISLELDGPWGTNSATYPTAATLAAGVAVVLTFTNTIAAVSLALSLPKVHFPRKTPPWNGREEVMLPLAGMAKATAANNELVVTLDSTP